MDLSISYIYGEAWDLAKKNIVPFLVYFLITAVIGACVVACVMPSGFWSTYMEVLGGNTHAAERLNQMQTFSPLQLLQYVVSAIVMVPLYNGIIGICRGTRKFNFDSAKLPAKVYLNFVVWYIAYVLIVIIGAIFLIVPGVYIGIRLWQGGFYLVEHHDATIKQAMSWSWQATSGRVLELLGLLLVGIIAIFACMIPCMILAAVSAMLGPVGIAIVVIAVIAIIVLAFFWEVVFYLANGMIYTTLCEE